MNKKELKKKYLHDQHLKDSQGSNPIIARMAINQLNKKPKNFIPIDISSITIENIRENITNVIDNFIFKNKNEDDDYLKLPALLKPIYSYEHFIGEWNNGGFDQYLSNSAAVYIPDLIKFASLINHSEFVTIVKKALGYFVSHAEEMIIFGNIKTWRTMATHIKKNDYIEFDDLEKLDNDFFKIYETIESKVHSWMSTHHPQIKEEIIQLNLKI